MARNYASGPSLGVRLTGDVQCAQGPLPTTAIDAAATYRPAAPLGGLGRSDHGSRWGRRCLRKVRCEDSGVSEPPCCRAFRQGWVEGRRRGTPHSRRTPRVRLLAPGRRPRSRLSGRWLRWAAIEFDSPGTHAPRKVESVLWIRREHSPTQAVLRIVGDGHSLVLVVIGQDGQDGPEDLLLRDAHGRLHTDEDGWLDEPPAVQSCWPTAAQHDPGSLCDSGLDVALHPLALSSARRADPVVSPGPPGHRWARTPPSP
jgi:hypothetical protein